MNNSVSKVIFKFICRKYEEICAPRVEEFCFITDNTYTKAEVFVSCEVGEKLITYMEEIVEFVSDNPLIQ
jgi:hypothetical protein